MHASDQEWVCKEWVTTATFTTDIFIEKICATMNSGLCIRVVFQETG